MADSTAVAIVGVSVGALVALVGPPITGRQITKDQKRKFEQAEWLADRAELRKLFDKAVARLDQVETAIRELNQVYLRRGEERLSYEDVLRRPDDALRRGELLQARLAIRVGAHAAPGVAYREALEQGRSDLNMVNRHVVMPRVAKAPGHRELEAKIREIETATERFVVAARERLEARIG